MNENEIVVPNLVSDKELMIVKIGSDERPAANGDILSIQKQLTQVANNPNLTIVTHHAFEIEVVTKPSNEEILVVKVGNYERPASPDDIRNMQLLLAKVPSNKETTIVTHHAVKFEFFNKKYLENIEAFEISDKTTESNKNE